jgi:predicted nucleotide-binding protein
MGAKVTIEGLELFKQRLLGEVVNSYKQRGAVFGGDRFNAWKNKFAKFLQEHLPSEVSGLNKKLTHYVFTTYDNESDVDKFWREDGENMLSFIDSLIIDIEHDEYDFSENEIVTEIGSNASSSKDLSSVFIVHGHNGEAKEKTARFIEKLGFKAVILHEQVNRGKTIIEKIEKYSNVGFAIVLYTPDDLGNVKDSANSGELLPRARQNVIFEHGYLIAKIGREHVVPLVVGSVELPNDISGMVYISDSDWQVDIAKEMKASGYKIDFNDLM